MTSAEWSITTIKHPFAYPNGSGVNVSQIGNDASSDYINWPKGIPSRYTGTAPANRLDVNLIGCIGTREHFFQQCGGYYTFDKNVSDEIGGYPKYAILLYLTSDGMIRRLMSAIENNKDDFTKDQSFIGDSWTDVSDISYVSTRRISVPVSASSIAFSSTTANPRYAVSEAVDSECSASIMLNPVTMTQSGSTTLISYNLLVESVKMNSSISVSLIRGEKSVTLFTKTFNTYGSPTITVSNVAIVPLITNLASSILLKAGDAISLSLVNCKFYHPTESAHMPSLVCMNVS